ncbi:hypothetical protein [Paraglaciecola sp. 25GB23A]|jgi:hypothetical protein|uniref:hypothetical protein n=1 Tax=Paraglaciecola sp. 25GB23A TaxID=3156068 RepID=UPI0032AE8F70|tara:strand:- start:5889 stop:6242 length:354 start_codon:yes stop_codon:yes gene_type:complete
MERINHNISFLLISAVFAVGIVSFGAYFILAPFEEIQREFDAQLPLWISWVFPSFRFWWLMPFALLIVFACSLNSKIKNTLIFNQFSVRASIAGFLASVILIVFSVAAIYWPVMQST